MGRKDMVFTVILFGFIAVIFSFAFIGIYYVMTYVSGDYNNCFFVESKCLDLTERNKYNTEVPIETCRDGYNCNEYCEKTYDTKIDWVSKCITDGSEPSCINIQACVCK